MCGTGILPVNSVARMAMPQADATITRDCRAIDGGTLILSFLTVNGHRGIHVLVLGSCNNAPQGNHVVIPEPARKPAIAAAHSQASE